MDSRALNSQLFAGDLTERLLTSAEGVTSALCHYSRRFGTLCEPTDIPDLPQWPIPTHSTMKTVMNVYHQAELLSLRHNDSEESTQRLIKVH